MAIRELSFLRPWFTLMVVWAVPYQIILTRRSIAEFTGIWLALPNRRAIGWSEYNESYGSKGLTAVIMWVCPADIDLIATWSVSAQIGSGWAKEMLRNARHEAFAQGVAEGKSSRAAYLAAFPKCAKDVAADASATKLLSRPEVRARIDELIAAAAEKAGVTIERVVAELARIGFADIRQVVS
jgi:hypothetical protein